MVKYKIHRGGIALYQETRTPLLTVRLKLKKAAASCKYFRLGFLFTYFNTVITLHIEEIQNVGLQTVLQVRVLH